MNPSTYHKYVEEVSGLVEQNRHLWYEMQDAKIASWRYLKLLSQGHYANPSVDKLAAIKDYIRSRRKRSA